MIITGFGLSCRLPALVAASCRWLPPVRAGTAGGLLNAVRQVGAVLGVSVMGVAARDGADGTSRALLLAAALTVLALAAQCGTRWAGRRAAGQDRRVPARTPM